MVVYYKCCILIELTFMNGLMLIRQGNPRDAIFVAIGIF